MMNNFLMFMKLINKIYYYSLIFAHNVRFDIDVLKNELRYWGMKEIPIKIYRCLKRIFLDVIVKLI